MAKVMTEYDVEVKLIDRLASIGYEYRRFSFHNRRSNIGNKERIGSWESIKEGLLQQMFV